MFKLASDPLDAALVQGYGHWAIEVEDLGRALTDVNRGRRAAGVAAVYVTESWTGGVLGCTRHVRPPPWRPARRSSA